MWSISVHYALEYFDLYHICFTVGHGNFNVLVFIILISSEGIWTAYFKYAFLLLNWVPIYIFGFLNRWKVNGKGWRLFCSLWWWIDSSSLRFVLNKLDTTSLYYIHSSLMRFQMIFKVHLTHVPSVSDCNCISNCRLAHKLWVIMNHL